MKLTTKTPLLLTVVAWNGEVATVTGGIDTIISLVIERLRTPIDQLWVALLDQESEGLEPRAETKPFGRAKLTLERAPDA